MHWKIRRDPYLAPLFEKRGSEAVMAAGFFFDDDEEDAPLDDVDWLTTPFPKRPITGERPVVLLSTGGFCPIHDGHLAMMNRGREAAANAGLDVIGGYVSPGHDAYVSMKCGAAAIPAHERLRLCAEAVGASDWLSVDPWEAMHRRVSVNFTDVTVRLERYLRAHVDPRIEVVYVAGGDNARFALAFSERGRAIVVGRPNAEAEFEKWRKALDGHPRVIWADGDHAAASRTLRKTEWKEVPRPLVLRMEDARAVQTLGLARYDAFQAELLSILAVHATVRGVPLREPPVQRGVISLDAMFPSQPHLAVSRLFALGGYEMLGHVARPGAPALEDQIAAIPPGRYLLRDDDRVTGGTLSFTRALLPPEISLTAIEVAIEQVGGEDVLDARDFLLGADHGGLVVALAGGSIGRVPYLLPYVDPAARASVLASRALSIDVWSLNARTFATTQLRVSDLPATSRAMFAPSDDRRLEEVCQWHVDRLRSLQGRRDHEP